MMILYGFVYLMLITLSLSDEPNSSQHVDQFAARNRELNDIESLFGGEQTVELNSTACLHMVLNLKVTLQQLEQFAGGLTTALRLANVANNLFLTIPGDNSDLGNYPPSTFTTLARSSLESNALLVSVGIAFLKEKSDSLVDDGFNENITFKPLAAYSYRKSDHVFLTDKSTLFNQNDDQRSIQWLTEIIHRQPLRPIEPYSDQSKSVLTLNITREEDGSWFRSPFLDCGASEQWVVAHSFPFFGRASDGNSAKLKGVVLATFPLSKIDINQCDDSVELLEHNTFGGTHKCDSVSTKCVAIAGMGFVRGGYQCRCRATHYLPTSHEQYFNGTDIEHYYQINNTMLHHFRCLPCPKGCSECSGSHICTVQYDSFTRLVPVCFQVVVILFTAILAFIVFKLRRCKIIATSLWTVLEVTLLGAIIIYSSIFFRYMKPTVLLCLFEPSVRELGFALFYGAIVLKLYRNLVEHRTRKAHRYVMKDRDLMRYLAGLIIFVITYLSAWVAFMSQLAKEGYPILERGRTMHGLPFDVCRSLWWEYVTEVGELLFVLFGLYLCWQLRKAGRDTKDLHELRERRAMAVALIMEFVFSSCLYIVKHILILKAHPDLIFLAYFFRTHLTVSVSLILIILPKLWCVGGGLAGREFSRRTTASCADGAQELRLCEAIANGELETANISQLDPEEIRSELRRVYTQLEELKSRTMRKDNPHISKRRGGRKPTHRRFSLQSRRDYKEKHQLKKHRQYHFDNFEENKTPEESVCSIEGPSVLSVYADGPSTYSEMGTPIIIHRNFKLN